MLNLLHPYPRYGLAIVLLDQKISTVPDDLTVLAKMVSKSLELALNRVRVHTSDNPTIEGTRELRYYYVDAENLNRGKQDSKNYYYLAPHVATSDTAINKLIENVKQTILELQNGTIERTTSLQRSFSPFTSKLNQGKSSLSEPKTSLLTAALTMLATLTNAKPATQVEFKNQVIIPAISLKDMKLFADLFTQMNSANTEGLMMASISPNSKYYRPKLHRGNYPNAPKSPLFGPVGLLGAMGAWAKRAGKADVFKEVLEEITNHSIYLVSYEGTLMRQERIGHHVARIATEYDIPEILNGLFQVSLYNELDNKPDSPKRQLFFMMAGRFLQLYSRPAFQDFLAFRGQYHVNFLPILEDYFMNEHQISAEIVRAAKVYGTHLNYVAYLAAKDETEKNKTGRNLYAAKSRFLAEMESVVMNAKSTSELFALINVRAGRLSERDVSDEIYPLMEASMTEVIDRKTTQNMVLAFMRLRSPNEPKEDKTTTKDTSTTENTPSNELGEGF